MPGFSLIDTSGLSAPATMLVEKISNAIGRHFDPRQTIRMALAEAEAQRILKLTEIKTAIEVEELRARAASRFMNEEMTKQENIESITQKAIPNLNDDASPEDIEDDWISNFFDKCRIVSDADMQELWARVLAGQGNNPGSFSRRTVNLLADLDKKDAELFAGLCCFAWKIRNDAYPLVFDTDHEIYQRSGITFDSLGQLEALGLIRFASIGGFTTRNLPRSVTVSYGSTAVLLTLPNASENDLTIGKVLLTQSGLDLFRVVKPTIVEGFFEYVYDKWASESLVPPRQPN